MLKVKNLTKKYGDFLAVDDISFKVGKGIIKGFIGHNGAGKTTSLKSICSILDFEKGSIEIDGLDLKTNPIECKRRFVFISDEPVIYDFLTGIQYLEYISDIYSLDRDKVTELIKKYSKELEIETALANPVSSYSHGMKQKLVIISAIIVQPKLLVLDEPFVGLDPMSTFKLKEYLKEICENGSSVIFSTHVLEVAQNLCDEILIIKKGKIIADGKTNTLISDSSLEKVFLGLSEEQ